uniref:Uncharacterized protein n=1 Tax=Meloidogyne hapla TaxID=6305 RepID=A0A1I8C172_MELHA
MFRRLNFVAVMLLDDVAFIKIEKHTFEKNDSNILTQILIQPKSHILKEDRINNTKKTRIDNLTIIKNEKNVKENEEKSEENDEESLSQIDDLFQNRKTFTCPLVKQLLATGSSASELSPEDVDVVAAMGDALSA